LDKQNKPDARITRHLVGRDAWHVEDLEKHPGLNKDTG
jgi:hypothetical protein